jgi:hypothetical protein
MQIRLVSAHVPAEEHSLPSASDISCEITNRRTRELVKSGKLQNTDTPLWHESLYLHETLPDDVLDFILRKEMVRAADPVLQFFGKTVPGHHHLLGHAAVTVRVSLLKSSYILDRALPGGERRLHTNDKTVSVAGHLSKIIDTKTVKSSAPSLHVVQTQHSGGDIKGQNHSNANEQYGLCPTETVEGRTVGLPRTSVVRTTATAVDSQHAVADCVSSPMDIATCVSSRSVVRASLSSGIGRWNYQSILDWRGEAWPKPCCCDHSLSALLPTSSGDINSRSQLLLLAEAMVCECTLEDGSTLKFFVVDPRMPCLSELLPSNPYKKCVNLKYTVGEVRLAISWIWRHFLDALPDDARSKAERMFQSFRSCVTSPGEYDLATWQAYLDSVTHVYPTWKVDMRYVEEVFGTRRQPWNRGHANARKIFDNRAVQGAVKVQHAAL